MSLLSRLHTLNHCGDVIPLIFLSHTIGLVSARFADELPSTLFVRSTSSLTLLPDVNGRFPQKAIEQWFQDYFSQNDISDWRNEAFAVYPLLERTSTRIGKLNRGILAYLGITGYGVHVNGYVRTAEGLAMWVAKRAPNKRDAPSKWDQIAAGGVSYPLSPFAAMQKESQEEAGIDESRSATATLGNELTYLYEQGCGVRPDTIFCYDLRLPDTFQPTCNDGEVECFALRPIAEILTEIGETERFKPNSAAVIIDFAIRHGVLTGADVTLLRKQLSLGKRRIQQEIGVSA